MVLDSSLFLFFLATHSDENDHNDGDNEEKGNGNEDSFENYRDEAHFEEAC